MSWEPAEFLIATIGGPVGVSGYVYRSLGLHMTARGSPKGRRRQKWALTHLGSGHRLCFISGKAEVAFPIASEIAECGDWDWDGFRGYLNRDPEISKRALSIIDGHPECSRGRGTSSESVAQEIAIARAG